MFTTSVTAKWERLAYIDLFAGAGRSRVEGRGVIVTGVSHPGARAAHRFDKYILCEEDDGKRRALEARG